MKNLGLAVIFLCVLIVALMFTATVMQLIKAETQLNLGKGIYVLSAVIFLIAFVPPIALIILIRKWAGY